MNFALTLCVFVALCGFAATSQTMPTSSGSCGVTASGLMMCESLSTPPVRFKNGPAVVRDATETEANTDSSKAPEVVPKGLFVTRFTLEPGAPLHRTSEGHDVLIVCMSGGKMVNEAKTPQTQLNVTNGLVMLMPKEEPYLFRNIGNKTLDLLVIDARK